MEIYKNLNGDSNVESFSIESDCIRVKFNGTAKVYSYSYAKAGQVHVEKMKSLAKLGHGLNGYINSFVKYSYD